MAVNPAQMEQLVQLLTQTTAGNTQAMQAATEQLKHFELQPGFGLMLLQLLRESNLQPGPRQAGAIYFKNYIRRLWSVEGAGAPISPSDRSAIKQHLLSLMLQAPKQVQVMLAAGLEEISISDYPEEWESLLPLMVQYLTTSQDTGVLKGTMETANTVFMKFRSRSRCTQLLKEVKYSCLGIQDVHLTMFKGAVQRVLGGNLQPQDMVTHFELLHATLGVFYSLNVVDLPEFFEDHRQEYFEGFLGLLKFQHEAVAGKGDQQGLQEKVKGSICESMALYSDKYQEEFALILLPCVKAVWEMLVGLDQQEKNDQLVAKGIHFLSSAAGTKWPQSPFEDPSVLSGICEKVVFPNIVLRDSDVELFEDNPLEYVRRDMESADQETRRRSAMDLVKAMGKLSEAKVTEILVGYVKALMGQAGQSSPQQAERFKDACIYLCIAMAVKGQTRREGVTVTNPSVNIMDFFTSLVLPELTSSNPVTSRSVLRASCLKFIAVFKNQLPRDQVGAILPAICKHVTVECPVVHTYAAICIEQLLSVRDKNPQGQSAPRYDPAAMRPTLLQVVDPMLQTIAASRGIPMNEYLMRTVARIFGFLKQHGAEAGLATLRPLATILLAMSANPTNPIFNHNLFEAIAAIVKVCMPVQPDAVEATLLPVFGQLLEQNVIDFLPYTFQILGLLLDATPQVKPLYQELFGRLLTETLWRAQANVPGLVRLLRAYFAKHASFMELLRSHLEAIFMRLQFILNNRKTEASAFDLVNAMYIHLPLELYQQHLKMLMTVLLTKLQTSKSPKTQRDFVVSCSLFVHRSQSNVLPQVMNEIQAGLLINIMSNVWMTVVKMSLKLDERKVCTMALAKLMAVDEVRNNAQLMSACCVGLVSLLSLEPSGGAKLLDEASDDEAGPADMGAGLEFEASFAKLRNTDMPGAQSGLAPDIANLHAAAKAVLQPNFGAAIVQLAQANAALQPLAIFLQR